jgi:hypothetical protein
MRVYVSANTFSLSFAPPQHNLCDICFIAFALRWHWVITIESAAAVSSFRRRSLALLVRSLCGVINSALVDVSFSTFLRSNVQDVLSLLREWRKIFAPFATAAVSRSFFSEISLLFSSGKV